MASQRTRKRSQTQKDNDVEMVDAGQTQQPSQPDIKLSQQRKSKHRQSMTQSQRPSQGGFSQGQISQELQNQIKKMRDKVLLYYQATYAPESSTSQGISEEIKDKAASMICRYVIFYYSQSANTDTLIPREKLSIDALQQLQQETQINRNQNFFGESLKRAQGILAHRFGIELQEIQGDLVQKFYIAKTLVPMQYMNKFLINKKDKVAHTNNLIVLALIYLEESRSMPEDLLVQKIQNLNMVQKEDDPSIDFVDAGKSADDGQDEIQKYIKNLVKQRYLKETKEKLPEYETLVKVYRWASRAYADIGEEKIQKFIQVIKKMDV